MARVAKRHREYFGCTIWYADTPGSSLRWSSETGYRRVAADTLEGVKKLIRDDMKGSLRGKTNDQVKEWLAERRD
jgi:hypothetical protein